MDIDSIKTLVLKSRIKPLSLLTTIEKLKRMTRTILIDTSTITGRVYRSGLFMRLCEQTSMSVGLKNNGVSFEGDEAEMMLGDTAKVVFKLKGQSLEALAEAQFRMFLMREEEQFNRVGLKRDEFFLTFKEMVEMMEPTPRISFYLLMNQENLGDISPQ